LLLTSFGRRLSPFFFLQFFLELVHSSFSPSTLHVPFPLMFWLFQPLPFFLKSSCPPFIYILVVHFSVKPGPTFLLCLGLLLAVQFGPSFFLNDDSLSLSINFCTRPDHIACSSQPPLPLASSNSSFFLTPTNVFGFFSVHDPLSSPLCRHKLLNYGRFTHRVNPFFFP